MDAVANGFAEGIAVGTNGLISEGSGQNLFLDGTPITPAGDGSLLPGITRECILELAGAAGGRSAAAVTPGVQDLARG